MGSFEIIHMDLFSPYTLYMWTFILFIPRCSFADALFIFLFSLPHRF